MDASPRRLLTIAEVCALLRLSRASVYRLIESGDLTRIKVLSSARITEDSLAAYIERSAA